MDAREIQREGSRQFIQSSTDIEVMVERREEESRAASSTSASSQNGGQKQSRVVARDGMRDRWIQRRLACHGPAILFLDRHA